MHLHPPPPVEGDVYDMPILQVLVWVKGVADLICLSRPVSSLDVVDASPGPRKCCCLLLSKGWVVQFATSSEGMTKQVTDEARSAVGAWRILTVAS